MLEGFQGDAKGIQITNMGILAEKSGSVCFFTRFFFGEEKKKADFHIYFLGEFVTTCNDTGTSTTIFGLGEFVSYWSYVSGWVKFTVTL